VSPAPARPGADAGAYVRRTWLYLELRFNGAVTQTRMLRLAPNVLCVGYTRSMLAALWLRPAPRRIGIVGLGGGAQAKFCHRHLRGARIEVVESDAGVLALRDVFRIPPDDARLAIAHGDGADWLRQRRGAFDVLLVDAYDAGGIPAHLDNEGFYRLCREALSADGVMAANLYDTDLRAQQGRLRAVFGRRHLLLPEPDMSNQVAFAWNGEPAPMPRARALRALPWPARWQLRASFERLAEAWLDRDSARRG